MRTIVLVAFMIQFLPGVPSLCQCRIPDDMLHGSTWRNVNLKPSASLATDNVERGLAKWEAHEKSGKGFGRN
jgi:hypothetical protein